MKIFAFLIVVLFIFSSCVFRHTDADIDLGDNYYFLPDGRMSTIGYNTAKEGQNRSGITMIEPKVVSYNFNDKYIIAKTVGVYDEAIKYWIIDKELNRSSNLIGLDSIAFQKELLDRNIKLKLEQ